MLAGGALAIRTLTLIGICNALEARVRRHMSVEDESGSVGALALHRLEYLSSKCPGIPHTWCYRGRRWTP